jgi:hypothetical protein
MKRTFEEVISRILIRRKFDSIKAGAYLDSLAFQLEKSCPREYEFIKMQLIRAGQIAASYSNPTYVLRELDNATEIYTRRDKPFDLFEKITLSTPVKPRSLDEFQEELDFLIGGKIKWKIKNNF